MNDDFLSLLFRLARTVPVAFVALMPVINPVGTALILMNLTEGLDRSTQRTVAKRIAVNTVVLLSITLIGGRYVLDFFGISVPIVQFAGGLLLMAMGWQWLQQDDAAKPTPEPGTEGADRSSSLSKTFYPFTFPITVGPGGIAVALTLSAHTTHDTIAETAVIQLGAWLGIVGVAVLVYFCFAYSTRLTARLGPTGTSVLVRLIAFVVVCLGAQISWTGIRALIGTLPR